MNYIHKTFAEKHDPQEIVHVDEVLKLLSAMTGDNRYETILYTDRGVKTMCEVAERLENIGYRMR